MDSPRVACDTLNCSSCSRWHPGEQIPSGGVVRFSLSGAPQLPNNAMIQCRNDPCKFSNCTFYHRGSACPPNGIRSAHAKKPSSNAYTAHPSSSARSSHPGSVCRYGDACRAKHTTCRFEHPHVGSPKRTSAPSSPLNAPPSPSSGGTSFELPASRTSAKYPIFQLYDAFCSELRSNDVVFIRASAASYAPSQLPQYATEATQRRVLVVCPDSTTASYLKFRISYEMDGGSSSKTQRVAAYSSSTPVTLAQLESYQIVTISAQNFVAIAHDRNWLGKFGVGVVLEAHLRRIDMDLAISTLSHISHRRDPAAKEGKLSLVLLSSDSSDLSLLRFFGNSHRVPLSLPAFDSVEAERLDIVTVSPDGSLSPGYGVNSHPFSSPSGSPSTRSSERSDDSVLKSIANAIYHRVEILQEHSANATVLVLSGTSKHAEYLEKLFSTDVRGHLMPSHVLTSTTDFKTIGQFQTSSSEQRIIFASEWAECLIPIPDVALVIDTGLTESLSDEGVVCDSLVPGSAKERRMKLCTAPFATYVSLYTASAELVELQCTPAELGTYVLQLSRARMPVNCIIPLSPRAEFTAHQLLIDTGCVEKGFSPIASAPLAAPLSPLVSEHGTNCIQLGTVDLMWAVVALKIVELSSNLQFAASVLALFSHGLSIFDKQHDAGDLKHRLAEASLNKKDTGSDLLYALNHFNKWRHASYDERTRLIKVHALKPSSLDRVSLLFQKYRTTLSTLYPQHSHELADSYDTEVLGRALALAYPDKIAEFLLPSHPEAGIFFPLSGVLSRLSLNSALAIPQAARPTSTEANFLLSLRVQPHEGQFQASFCHPLRLEWLPQHIQDSISHKLQKFSLCFSRQNVHFSCKDSVVSGLRALGKHRVVTATYDPAHLLLEVYCPHAQVTETGAVVKSLVDAYLASVVECERDLVLTAERVVTLRSGFFIANPNTGDRKVDFHAPTSVNSHEEFQTWVATVARVKLSDIASYIYGSSHHVKSTSQHAPISSVVFKSAADAQTLRSFLIQSRDSSALGGARIAFDSRGEQHYRIELVLFNNEVSKARASIEGTFSGAHMELATTAPLSDPTRAKFWVYTSSLTHAQRIVDIFQRSGAMCTKFVNVPHRHAALYAPALTSISTSMKRTMTSTAFEVGKGFVKLTGCSVREVTKAAQSLRLALAPSFLNLTGGWRMFFTQWEKHGFRLQAPNACLDIKMSPSRSGTFAAAATLYGTQVAQAPAIIEITTLFAKFRCVEIDISMAKLQFTQTRAGGAELAHFFAATSHTKGVSHRVDITSGTVFVFCPLKELRPEEARYLRKQRIPVSDQAFQRVCTEVAAICSRYTSAHSSEHAAPSKCGFCGDSDPDAESILCGHRFCTGCLVRETCSSVGPICCKHCSQVIPIKHFPQTSLLSMLSASLKLALNTVALDPALSKHLLLAQDISFCPNPDCGRAGDRPKDGSSYVQCEACSSFGCSLCGFRDQRLHAGETCEAFKLKLDYGDSQKHLEALFEPAEAFADSSVAAHLGSVVERIRNPLLERGCPAVLRFVRGLQAKGGLPLLSSVKFAWHGTTYSAIPLICHHGFDPTRRSGQVYGPGEYFGMTAVVSSGYARPDDHSHIMILAALLDVKELSVNLRGGDPFCYIVNNPTDAGWTTTYCLPLLIVRFTGSSSHRKTSLSSSIKFDLSIPAVAFSFLDAAPILGSHASLSASSSFKSIASNASDVVIWQWEDSNSTVAYSPEQTNQLETAYRLWRNNGPRKCALICSKLAGGASTSYEVDFSSMLQTNIKTNFQRRVKRIGGDLFGTSVLTSSAAPLAIWQWEDNNETKLYSPEQTIQLETAHRLWLNKGYSKCALSCARLSDGAAVTYEVDFTSMVQTNLTSKYQRKVKRIG